MAQTIDAGVIAAAPPTVRHEPWQRVMLSAIAVALVIRVAMMLGLAEFFKKAAYGPWVIEGLPWLGLGVAILALAAWASSAPGGIVLAGNRLMRHVLGWTLLAALLLVIAFFGDALAPVLGLLGKSGKVIARFCAAHGLFFATATLLVAAGLGVSGSVVKLVRAPAVFERIFALNLTAKFAAMPMMLVAIGVFTGGTVWTVVYSFTNSKLLPKAQWVGLDQYERLWGTTRWMVSIENLAIYGFCMLAFSFVIGFVLAALMDQKIRFENTFRTIILYPFALSFIVTGLIWQWVLNPDFGFQGIIRSFGWESFSFDPLYNPDIAIFGVLIAALWQSTGLIMVLMLAGMRGIDQEIWKAARVDGIPAWKTYVFIVIPMMRPVFITTLVLIASSIVRVYDLVVAQTSGGPGLSTEMPAKYVYDYMFRAQNLGQAFAASTMMLLAVAIVIIPWAYLEFGSRKRG